MSITLQIRTKVALTSPFTPAPTRLPPHGSACDGTLGQTKRSLHYSPLLANIGVLLGKRDACSRTPGPGGGCNEWLTAIGHDAMNSLGGFFNLPTGAQLNRASAKTLEGRNHS